MFLAIGKDVARAIVAPPRMMGPAPPGFSPPRDPAPAFGDSWTSDTLAELDEMCEQLGRTDTAVERMLEHTPRAIAPPPPESHEHCAARIQYLTKQVERLEKSNRALTAALEDAENVECGLAKAASDRWKHAEWYSDLETAYLHRATGPLLEYLDKCVPVGTVRRMFQLSDLALGRRAKEVQVLVAEPSGRPMRPADTQRLGAAFTKTLEEDGAWKDAPVDAAKCIDIGRMLSARPEDAIFDPKMLFQDRRIVVAVKCATYADAERGMPSVPFSFLLAFIHFFGGGRVYTCRHGGVDRRSGTGTTRVPAARHRGVGGGCAAAPHGLGRHHHRDPGRPDGRGVDPPVFLPL